MAGSNLEQVVIGKRVKTTFTIALLLLNLFFLYKFVQYRTTAGDLETRMVSLEGELEQTVQQLAQSKQQTEELNTLLRQTYQEIEALKSEMEANPKGGVNQQRIENFLRVTEQYLVQIDSLVRENQRLLTENQSLKDMIEDEKVLSSKLRSEKEALEEKLGGNRPLVLDNLLAAGVVVDKNGRESPAHSIADLSRIKVCFDVRGVFRSPDERKIIYVEIVDPKGVTVTDPKTPQGSFSKGEKSAPYTLKATVLKNDRTKNLCLYSEKSKQIISGQYTVSLYTDSQLIGSTKFSL